MLSITDHQGNANQNHIEISPHTCQNEGYQKNRDNSARVWRKETPVLWLVESVGIAAMQSMSLKLKDKATI